MVYFSNEITVWKNFEYIESNITKKWDRLQLSISGGNKKN